MPIVAGIDEAGYGPLLGPLVVSRVAFRVPEAAASEDLWERLSDGVTQRRSAGDTRVAVADSKLLYSRRRGLAAIEEGVLAFLGCELPSGIESLLESVHAADPTQWAPYPWYQAMAGSVPAEASESRLQEKRDRLAQCLEATGVAFCGARCVPVDVRTFNSHVARTDNKATALAANVGTLLCDLWERFDGEAIDLVVDKQGGRNNYRRMLYRLFGECRIRPHIESRPQSLYEVSDGHRALRVAFEMKADRRHLPVAAASMFSKYLRELFMAQLNAWWQERVPGLEPTAGYPQDARRFLQEIEPARRDHGVPLDLLVRCR